MRRVAHFGFILRFSGYFTTGAAALSVALLSIAPARSIAGDYVYIGGSPASTIAENSNYFFQPWVSIPAASRPNLRWTIYNKPYWASFNTSTGQLTGKVYAAQVGTYKSITITASDGITHAAMPVFAITVTGAGAASSNPPSTNPPPSSSPPAPSSSPPAAAGTASLSWAAPTTNIDGTPLTNLAGYIVSWGTSAGALTHTARVATASTASYKVTNLSPGTWYFDIAAYNNVGLQSPLSSVVSAVIK